MSNHKHRAPSGCADGPRRRTVCFTSPVNDRNGYNTAAHGGVCIVETCNCGYERKTNMNGRHSERGAWLPPAYTDAEWHAIMRGGVARPRLRP